MAKLLYAIICSLAVQGAAEMGRQRRWRMERRKKAAAAAAARREREKNAPRDAESTSDGASRAPRQITKLRHAAAVVPRSKRLGWRRGSALEQRRRLDAFCSNIDSSDMPLATLSIILRRGASATCVARDRSLTLICRLHPWRATPLQE